MYRIGLVLLLLGLGPLILSAGADAIAGAAGCSLEKTAEDQVMICMIGGHNWGEWLYTLSILRWIWIVSLPVAALGAVVLVLRFGMDIFRKRRS